jgi:GRIP domain
LGSYFLVGEADRLLPVVATLLQFSPEEVKVTGNNTFFIFIVLTYVYFLLQITKCQQAQKFSKDSLSQAAPVWESGATQGSFFSRFSFT